MKNEIISLVGDAIKETNVFVDDCFISKEEGKNVFNIALDSEDVIDLNKITEVSRVINEILDKSDLISNNNIDEVDIYSKEKGEI